MCAGSNPVVVNLNVLWGTTMYESDSKVFTFDKVNGLNADLARHDKAISECERKIEELEAEMKTLNDERDSKRFEHLVKVYKSFISDYNYSRQLVAANIGKG